MIEFLQTYPELVNIPVEERVALCREKDNSECEPCQSALSIMRAWLALPVADNRFYGLAASVRIEDELEIECLDTLKGKVYNFCHSQNMDCNALN